MASTDLQNQKVAKKNQENNSENLKTKLDNNCIICTDQKNLQNNSKKVWLTLFKEENNFYKQGKQ